MLLQEIHVRSPITTVFVTHDIAEAAILGDAIWVMDGHGGIVEKVEVSASRPRAITAPEVVATVNRLMQLVMPEQNTLATASEMGSVHSLQTDLT